MSQHYCSCDRRVWYQKWPGEQWESTNSCLQSPHATNQLLLQHSKHKLRRTWSDPGVASLATTQDVHTKHQRRKLVNIPSIEESISLSLPLIYNLPQETLTMPPNDITISSKVEDESLWMNNCEQLDDDDDSLCGPDEVVNLDNLYYEDDETKAQIFPFHKCSLRFHGLLFLIIMYAAGYLAYVIASPSSKKRCNRQPTTASQVTPYE